MPDANALNLAALRTAVLGRRFPAASQASNATRWLSTAYTDVWNAADWTFKRVSLSSLAVVSGAEKPTMPVDYADTLALFDQYGDELERMPQERFEQKFAADFANGNVGQPWAFTVIDRRVILGPRPALTGTFKHSYRRRLSHKLFDQETVDVGFMNDDTDYPLWPDHHGVLVARAQSIGLQEINDPTWQGPQQEYERQLARMEEDLAQQKIGVGRRSGAQQWGRN